MITERKKISNERIRELAEKASKSLLTGDYTNSIGLLKPLLNAKIAFSKLDLLGREIGEACCRKPEALLTACDQIVASETMGSFVVASRALTCLLDKDLETVMERTREYIVKGNKWYVCDIIGERSLGQALVDHFDRTLPWLARFLTDENKWVKRSTGVAIHYFSKRVINGAQKTQKLLELLEPHIEEKQLDVIKGIGWGLKTIGKHHPDLLVPFLEKQLKAKKKISKLMIKKALTYLGKDRRSRLERHVQGL